MSFSEHNVPPDTAPRENTGIDYSEMYRNKERKQLKKRLRRTRNTLFICSIATIAGALAFWVMPEIAFFAFDFLIYAIVAIVLFGMALLSYKRPYAILLTALIMCLGLWAVEILTGKADNFLIEGTIQKLFIVSLMVSALHSSKEAELIKKELTFS